MKGPTVMMTDLLTTRLYFKFFLIFVLTLGWTESKISINSNGGYEDLTISISKEVPPIACQQILQNIQSIFTTASETLRRATEGRVYFHRILIIVPPGPGWDSRTCGRPLNGQTSRSRVAESTIKIGTEHPIFGQQPWTQQSNGKCGSEGDFISVGYHYILQYNETGQNVIVQTQNTPKQSVIVNGLENDPDDVEEMVNGFYGNDFGLNGSPSVPTDRAFVHEWAKYRYGIFEEIGFANDPVYPTYYTENGERKPTSCTNDHVQGNWSSGCNNSDGWARNESPSYQNNGSLSSQCLFTPTSPTSHLNGQNDRITSSLGSYPGLKNVHTFCTAGNHNRRAPTKHNFLCEGKSTSEVIYSHPDFKDLPFREPSVLVPPPEFIVKQITTPRFLLVVEETGNMNLRDVWKFLKLAVRKFIKYDLPIGTQIGLVTVSSNDVRVLANMTSLQSLSVRRALADKLQNYPNVDTGGNISIRRGIFAAVEILKSNQQKAAGSVIILVSQGTVSNVDLEASLDLLKREEVTVASIEYPSLGDEKIAQLSQGTNGPHFSIRESGVGPSTHIGVFVQLINAFMTIQRFFTEDIVSPWPTMLHQQEYKGDSRSFVEANFSFESTSSQTPAEFFIYTSNPNDPKINSAELTSPSGVKYTTQLSDLHDINVIKIDAVINEPGVWRYRIERLADSHQSHFVQVLTKSSSEDLSVRLYTNVNLQKVANLTSTPLILYTEVKRKNSPVIDADVEATILTANNKKWTIKLLDNGNGDPDITKGDGVYSRYFIVPSGILATQLEISARIVVNPYRARFIVVNQEPLGQLTKIPPKLPESRCCGSLIQALDPKAQNKIIPFGERVSNSLQIKISDIPPLGFYPPSRIGDLRLAYLPTFGRNISLTWTAPGEDLDYGITASYEIFYSPDKSNENWALIQEFTADLESGVLTDANVSLPYYGSFLLSVRAIDFYRKAGLMSNVIRVTVVQPPKILPNSGGFLSVAGGGGNSLGITGSTTAPSSTDELTKFDLMLIIICGVVFIILLGGLVVTLLYCRKIGSTHRKSGGTSPGGKNPAESKISAITDPKNPKSPIHWSASELLGEHEKRHSMYGGSNSPQGSGSDGGHSSQLSQQQLHHQHQQQQLKYEFEQQHLTLNGQQQVPLGGGHMIPIPNGHAVEYNLHSGSSNRSRSSPESYINGDDTTDSPIPVPVRQQHHQQNQQQQHQQYSVCIDDGRANWQGYPQQQVNYHQQNLQNPPVHGYFNQIPLSSSHHRFSNIPNIQTGSPLPPPPPSVLQNSNSSHLMHYDPDLQGSLNSVNSKKRNITMV